MKHRAFAVILAFSCLILIFSMGCGGSSSHPASAATATAQTVGISAVTGSAQSAAAGKGFAAPLVVTVTTNGIPTAGEKVIFSAPATGAGGTFANGTATDIEITGITGMATSSILTANATAGPFTVTAMVTGAPKPVSFALTNLAPVSNSSYVFYMNGQDALNSGSYYALAGVVTLDANGNVLSGEQDYNDFSVVTSPQPSGDTISGGALTFPAGTPSGQGTLTLITNNPSIGVLNLDGVTSTETFAIQFVNASHALIMEFDGTATSSGSYDLQTLAPLTNGGYAFSFSGTDNSNPFAIGGVFSLSGSSISNGTIDINDGGSSTGVSTQLGAPLLSGAISTPDASGRGTLTGITNPISANGVPSPISLNYYIVNAKTIRLIDVDAFTDAAVGSAFSQGAGPFSNASLGASVFTVNGNLLDPYDAIGQFTTVSTATPATFSGVGDDSEPNDGVLTSTTPQALAISGTYSIGTNGYGNMAFTINQSTFQGLGNIGSLGVYVTDPTLNLNDPNNPIGGGGALVVDLDDGSETQSFTPLPGGAGVIIPQTDTSAASFAGNYAAGWQLLNFNFCFCEADMLAQGTMIANGALSLTGLVSDPGLTFGGTPTSSGNTFTGTPLPDTIESTTGRYTMLLENTVPNPLSATIEGAPFTFEMVIYQASGGQLFWLGYDLADGSPVYVSSGPIQQQSATGIPATRKSMAKIKATKTVKRR